MKSLLVPGVSLLLFFKVRVVNKSFIGDRLLKSIERVVTREQEARY